MDFKDRSYNPPVNACIQDNFLQEGISLLDHFAGLAMNGFLAKYGNEGEYPTLARMSYDVAKAMLEARKEALKK